MTNTTNPATICFDAVSAQVARYAVRREISLFNPLAVDFRADLLGQVMAALANGMTVERAVRFMDNYADAIIRQFPILGEVPADLLAARRAVEARKAVAANA